jgi:tRNA pseudouridine55 synthase
MFLMDGVLIVDKPAGLTSHDVVAQIRRILHEKRIGHTGTLDPFATGVLAILVGRATRLAQFLSGLEKEYEAVIRLGYATDTGDITGRRIDSVGSEFNGAPGTPAEATQPWSKEQFEAGLASLRGEIDQVPPMYSAKKQGGRRLYELARRGEEVERKPVPVCIYKFEPVRLFSGTASEWLKDNHDGTFDFEVRVACSAGTYVRTLAEDFGKRLGVGAHLAELRRTRVGAFNVREALTLEQVKVHYAEESLGTILYTPDEALAHLPFVDLSAEQIKRVLNGIDVQVSDAAWSDGERVRLRDEHGKLIAIADYSSAAKLLHPSVVIAREGS